MPRHPDAKLLRASVADPQTFSWAGPWIARIRAPAQSRERARAIAGHGLEGDRHVAARARSPRDGPAAR